jgi:hypothetical protein
MSGKTPTEILREILAKKASQANASISSATEAPSTTEVKTESAKTEANGAPPAAQVAAEPSVVSQVAVETATATMHTEATIANETKVLTEEQLLPLSKQMDKRIPVSYVTVKTGMTINLGNYSNGKVDVSISVPVGFEITPEYQQKINEAYEFGKNFTESKTREQAKKLIDYAKTRQ